MYERRPSGYHRATRRHHAPDATSVGRRHASCDQVVTTTRWTLLLVTTLAGATTVRADLVPVRFPEGPAHGFVLVSGEDGGSLAHGELEQWFEGDVVASHLVFHFDDGSLYDELVRFSQRRVFRLESYHLVQHGPSFTETLDAAFDRSGQYRVRRRATADAEEEQADGHTDDLPADVGNGMTSILLKSLTPGQSTTTHLVTFRPTPLVLQLHLDPEGHDRYWIGKEARTATRFRVQPEVTGVRGIVASMAGKQPPMLHVWIAQGRAPAMVAFQGPLVMDGPVWRIEPTGPVWRSESNRGHR